MELTKHRKNQEEITSQLIFKPSSVKFLHIKYKQQLINKNSLLYSVFINQKLKSSKNSYVQGFQ